MEFSGNFKKCFEVFSTKLRFLDFKSHFSKLCDTVIQPNLKNVANEKILLLDSTNQVNFDEKIMHNSIT